MVADVIVETPDTTTLVLFTGNDRLEYLAGHFLTIDPHQFESLERFTSFLEDLKGRREPPRAYSMSSAPHERYLAVTVKEERYVSDVTRFPPLLSPLLVKRTLRGMRLVVTGFTGSVHARAGRRLADRSHRPRLRRIGQRAELLDAEVRARASPDAPAHVRLLQQDVGRRDLPRRAGAAGRSASRPREDPAHADARRRRRPVRSRTCARDASIRRCCAKRFRARRSASSTSAGPASRNSISPPRRRPARRRRDGSWNRCSPISRRSAFRTSGSSASSTDKGTAERGVAERGLRSLRSRGFLVTPLGSAKTSATPIRA